MKNSKVKEQTEKQNLKIGIVGLGLIGASFALALNSKTEFEVLGFDIAKNTLNKAKKLNIIKAVLDDKKLPTIDVLIFATNPRTTIKLFGKYVPYLKFGSIVFDLGGVKQTVCNEMWAYADTYEYINFIGGHPMAGREFSGIDFADKNLFDNASMLLVDVKSDNVAKATLLYICTRIGFKEPKFTAASEHDKIIAYTSQGCHAISSAFCQNSLSLQHKGFSAGSFRDLTRVARLNSNLWSELFIDNKDNLADCLDEFILTLQELNTKIKEGDEKAIKSFLENGNIQKDKIDKE